MAAGPNADLHLSFVSHGRRLNRRQAIVQTKRGCVQRRLRGNDTVPSHNCTLDP